MYNEEWLIIYKILQIVKLNAVQFHVAYLCDKSNGTFSAIKIKRKKTKREKKNLHRDQ